MNADDARRHPMAQLASARAGDGNTELHELRPPNQRGAGVDLAPEGTFSTQLGCFALVVVVIVVGAFTQRVYTIASDSAVAVIDRSQAVFELARACQMQPVSRPPAKIRPSGCLHSTRNTCTPD